MEFVETKGDHTESYEVAQTGSTKYFDSDTNCISSPDKDILSNETPSFGKSKLSDHCSEVISELDQKLDIERELDELNKLIKTPRPNVQKN